FAEVFANIKSTVFESDEKDGDVLTTIEPFVQTTLQDILVDIDAKWDTDGVGGIVMDPRTGEIVAMAYAPDFNPNEYSKAPNASVYANPNVESVFEFGSVIKPLVMAGALDAGVVTKDTTYVDKGFIKVGDRTINNFDKVGRGTATMQDVLNQSLNTGMVFVEQKLGKERFKKYLLGYQINQKTGIDLPGEVTSLTSNLNTNRDVEFANAAFGQGIALTPVAAIKAFSALGTGGVLPTPHVGKMIKYEFTEKELEHPTAQAAIKPETTEKITDMLVGVAESVLKTYRLSVPHHTVAMKTGTAQMANPNGGGYFADKYLHSMFAYFPAYDPKFIVFVYAKNPKGIKYAAQTLSVPT
ncbi:MAG TPA: penicillin-binding transpeptidase domain-containing protein, partial [Blastocatellia bacterium]|nr:penicillin-binding transpeptidase domain-containing protein [Blastocatellia bacterium]